MTTSRSLTALVFAAQGSESGAAVMTAYNPVARHLAVVVPAGIEGQEESISLGVQVSVDGETWVPLYDANGAVALSVVGGRAYMLPDACLAWAYFRLTRSAGDTASSYSIDLVVSR